MRIEKEMGIKTGNAQQTTDARGKACADKRNAISTAVGHSVVTTSSLLLFNAGGTSSVNPPSVWNDIPPALKRSSDEVVTMLCPTAVEIAFRLSAQADRKSVV